MLIQWSRQAQRAPCTGHPACQGPPLFPIRIEYACIATRYLLWPVIVSNSWHVPGCNHAYLGCVSVVKNTAICLNHSEILKEYSGWMAVSPDTGTASLLTLPGHSVHEHKLPSVWRWGVEKGSRHLRADAKSLLCLPKNHFHYLVLRRPREVPSNARV